MLGSAKLNWNISSGKRGRVTAAEWFYKGTAAMLRGHGQRWVSHSLANLEHHHFKHEANRRPGDVHVHFFGADVFSFRDRLVLEEGDTIVVSFDQMGRPLRNPVPLDRSAPKLVMVNVL
jgi:hypothetical protein